MAAAPDIDPIAVPVEATPNRFIRPVIPPTAEAPLTFAKNARVAIRTRRLEVCWIAAIVRTRTSSRCSSELEAGGSRQPSRSTFSRSQASNDSPLVALTATVFALRCAQVIARSNSGPRASVLALASFDTLEKNLERVDIKSDTDKDQLAQASAAAFTDQRRSA